MTESFVLKRDSSGASQANRSVVITGASGNIGSYVAQNHHHEFDFTFTVRPGSEVSPKLEDLGKVVEADLEDCEALTRAFAGADTVLHLAAVSSPKAEWQTLLPSNIIGTYNVFSTALKAGCRRVVYASSIHAVSGYPQGYQVHDSEPVNPGDLYGVSKCFGEALGRYMAEQQGLSVIALRIGSFQPLEEARKPERIPMWNSFVSRRDLADLIVRCIKDDKLQFAIFHALSRNVFNRMDISLAEQLVGYSPQDNFSAENPTLQDLDIADQVRPHSETKE